LSSHPEFLQLSDADSALLFFSQSVESQQSRVVGRGLQKEPQGEPVADPNQQQCPDTGGSDLQHQAN